MARPKSVRSNPALRLGLTRQLHIYVSMFVAPSLLFFAVTGALQTFRIPDQKEAPALLVKLARVHKDDVFAMKPAPKARRPKPAEAVGDQAGSPVSGGGEGERAGRRAHAEGEGRQGGAERPAAEKGEAAAPAKPKPELSTTVLKWFFTVISIGIVVTTLFGLWMALLYNKRKLVMLAVLAAGAIAPVLILML